MTDATHDTVIAAVFAMNAYEHKPDNGLWSDDLGDFFPNLYAGTLGNYSLEAVSSIKESDENNFFAIAYRSSTGQTIIAYRGTTNPSVDAPNGYGIANGIPTGPDATNAIAFYQEVADLLNDPWQSPSDITVVGHSLGGGLAGFVGAIYGLHATCSTICRSTTPLITHTPTRLRAAVMATLLTRSRFRAMLLYKHLFTVRKRHIRTICPV